ncbi:4-(cytidine 5'-diphospho)-2-C-methyl-D-erythritol kinase (plasmid) [Rhizobium sp. TRM96647]|uniref:4-(cytidine 5'-diphospho)-2-C-methyl-D-erythritol kinase n=1 Tax=unclassified Rhizobium TaxID=2613769 RepID=UPI0021E7ECB5|nr:MULTISPECIES: 4-(cytidine 5'-diphospho)-2-C-methyl-D-erythritol kinase [unclassified Rhizobium]MCV3735435.1 4-(cytidine 5'-diphospho)-2-C-methyl-D-erythritol kinase [Rhizobium sp. TRM96647]MCV3757802.1 4-(cytidine 5'-diphospho)-2-C-methyl-D-erythritol kinase [Rhizobium sp. TRM96650]
MACDDGASGFTLTEPAPAKINLALHVVGQRADGYHLLDMLVTFAAFGDRVSIAPAGADRLTLSGRFAGRLDDTPGADNLVLRARDRLRAALTERGIAAPPVHLHLEKNLPVASGIGGGSADAAATLRGLLRHWNAGIDRDLLDAIALDLGADVPMCLASRPLVARGIGEDIELRADLPAFAMVLVNPLVGVPTPEIFRRLPGKHNPRLKVPKAGTAGPCWLAALQAMRNDLEAPATALCPEIETVRQALAATAPVLVRMSGSGATCFGLYHSLEAANEAAQALGAAHPGWFVIASAAFEGEDRHGAP